MFKTLASIIGLKAAVTFMLFVTLNLVSPPVRANKEEKISMTQERYDVRFP